MKTVFINATSCPQGGSMQVAIGFIREALKQAPLRQWKLVIAALPLVYDAIKDEAMAQEVILEKFTARPGSLLQGIAARTRLKALAETSRASIIFTILGPSYVRFSAPEIMGFADGFAITPEPNCYANYPLCKIPLMWSMVNFKLLLIQRAAHFWVETEVAKRGLSRRARISPFRITVVPNGVNALFSAALKGASPTEENEILMLGADYPHKNHRIIPDVAMILESQLPNTAWRFVVTLPSDSKAWIDLSESMKNAGLSHRLRNVGVLNLAECAEAYERAKLVFHPSLLEIFSAGYIEAMAAARPLVASNRIFAREICADAALYIEPTDANSCANAIQDLLCKDDLRKTLIESGKNRIKIFPDAVEKNGRLCDLISNVLTP